MFANLQWIHPNYMLDYQKVILMGIIHKIIIRKYINNKYIHVIELYNNDKNEYLITCSHNKFIIKNI